MSKVKIPLHDCGFSLEMNAVCPSCGDAVIKSPLPDPSRAHQMERGDAFMMAQGKLNQVLMLRLLELERQVAGLRKARGAGK